MLSDVRYANGKTCYQMLDELIEKESRGEEVTKDELETCIAFFTGECRRLRTRFNSLKYAYDRMPKLERIGPNTCITWRT